MTKEKTHTIIHLTYATSNQLNHRTINHLNHPTISHLPLSYHHPPNPPYRHLTIL